LSALSLLTAAGAATAADAPPAPSLAAVLESSGITATGYVEAGAEYISTIPSYRVFDVETQRFSLHQAALNWATSRRKVRRIVNITMGNDAQLIHSAGSNSLGPTAVPSMLHKPRSVRRRSGHVIAGKYVTLAGAEVINSTADTNFSRSLLFGFAIPFGHTGVWRATIAASDMLSFIVGLNNGWINSRPQHAKDRGSRRCFHKLKPFVLAAQGYFGSEPTAVGDGQRQLLDVVATFNATDSLSFVLNFDVGKQRRRCSGKDAKWTGSRAM